MIKIRTCINCRKKNNKDSMIRIVSNDSKLMIDYSKKINARGFYICDNVKCIKSLKEKMNKRKFKVKLNINKEEFSKLLDVLLEGMEK